jgi:hypothetical protein
VGMDAPGKSREGRASGDDNAAPDAGRDGAGRNRCYQL